MNFKFLGGILMVTGTCIGAGMLALPVATSSNDLISATILMILCWFIMTLGALYILETNLKLPAGANLVSMAKRTLGKVGAAIAWFSTLMLLFALLSAYITGGAQITQHWLNSAHIAANHSISAILFTIIMALIVLRGIHWVDYSNRGLMTIKSAALILLIIAIAPHAQWAQASFGTPHKILSATTVVITAFGYASIIPSLRHYFQHDIASLRKAIIIGSIIPLIIYILWNISVHSALPPTGPLSLAAMQQSGNASSQLAVALIQVTQSAVIKVFANIFTSVCVFTSFLGVGLALSDFLVDGTAIRKNNLIGLSMNAVLTFLLPLLIAIFYPKAFIVALSYAGIICVILLMLLPIAMAWAARIKFTNQQTTYQVFGGTPMLVIALVIALVALILSIVFF